MATSDLFQISKADLTYYIALFATFIGIIAALRPEWTGLLRRWIAKLDFSPFATIEIGYSTWGPTIGLLGSVHAYGGDQFVEKINLTLVRQRDKKTDEFEWIVFRKESISTAKGQDVVAEIATAFSVLSGDTKKINVLFSDTTTRDRFTPKLIEYRDLWDDATINDEVVKNYMLDGQHYEALSAFHASSAKSILETKEKLSSEMYWEEGDYAVSLSIKTKRPNKTFVFDGSFKLTNEEVVSLLRNTIQILFDASSMPGVTYQFVNPRLTMAASGDS